MTRLRLPLRSAVRRPFSALRRPLAVAGSRLRRFGPSLLLAALAAGLAYAAASFVFNAGDAFFAPIAAVLCAGITPGQRIHRAVEIAVGVAVGLAAADLLLGAIGAGAFQLGLAVVLAMGATIVFGSSPLLVNQSAVAAVLVVALAPEGGSDPLVRFADALIGGAVALALGALLAPEPQRGIRRATRQTFDELGSALRCVVSALQEADAGKAERAVAQARRVDHRLEELGTALDAARERARLGRHRGGAHLRNRALLLRHRLGPLAETIRALARAGTNAVRHGQEVDPSLITAIRQLAAAVHEVQRWVEGDGSDDDARDAALEAAGTASRLLRVTHPLAVQVAIGQVRAGAVDLLHATGLDRREAVMLLEEMAGRADVPGTAEAAARPAATGEAPARGRHQETGEE